MATFTATEFKVIEDGTYDGYFKGYEEVDFEFGPCFRMFFGITTEDGEEDEITGLATKPKTGSMGPKSKLRGWLEGLAGHSFVAGESIDMDKLIGKPCKLMISVEEKTRPDGSKSKFNKIVKVIAIKRKAAAPKPAATEDDELI